MRRIQLSEPINGPRGKIEHIDLREPRFRDYMDLLSPTLWVSMESGGGYELEVPLCENGSSGWPISTRTCSSSCRFAIPWR